MNLTTISIKRPVFAWMLMLGIFVFGILSFKKLGISQMPDVNFPVVSVSLNLMGAAPEVMEIQVVDVIEDALMGIQGIQSMTSKSRQETASIAIEFSLEKDIDVAVQEIQTRIAQVANMLPTDLNAPIVKKTNPEDQPILWLSVTADPQIPQDELMRYALNELYDHFSQIEGVGDLILGGYVDPQLRVWVSIPQLNRYELTATDLVSAIQKQHAEIPLGQIENEKKETNVKFIGEALNPQDFGKIQILTRNSKANYEPLFLHQVAKVEEGLADIRRASRFNGKPTVGIGILKQHGSNAFDVAQRVHAKVQEMQLSLKPGYVLGVRMDFTKFIKLSVDDLHFVLLLSAFITAIICFLFLGSFSSTINVILSIPTSIMGTFIVLYFFNFTLNSFTLLGLSLAIGIVIDDAIMMLENIVRHQGMKKDKVTAALDGSQEITFAAITATIAIGAIFIPVLFMQGIIGKFLYQYGITVTAAVMLSLLEALTLTPMRCSQFLENPNQSSRLVKLINAIMFFLETIYLKILIKVLGFPKSVILFSVCLFILSLLTLKKIPFELVPAQDQSTFILRFKAPVGVSFSFTDNTIKQAEKILLKIPEIIGVYSIVGGFSGESVNEGVLFVTLKPIDQRIFSQNEIMEQSKKLLKQKFKEIKISAQDLSLRGFSSSRGYPLEFSVQGENWGKLVEYTEKIIEITQNTNIITDANTDYQANMPEIHLVPNREKAIARGVSIKNISTEINALMGGVIMGPSTRYFKEGHRYDIHLKLSPQERTTPEQLKKIKVRNNYGELIPLQELVTIQEKPVLQMIMRRNRERAIPVYANITKGYSQQDALKEIDNISKKILPPGYHIVTTGSSKSLQDTFKSFLIALSLGLLFSYMILGAQFNSFIHPITILMALPFSISGALLALLLAKQSLNLYSLIGIILLLGIVKKNSILLVDFTHKIRQEASKENLLNVKQALQKACPIRLRPILMTSTATVAGALPVALSAGPGSETRIPMAVAMIGGVFLSTLLTLIVVPCVYCLFSKFERKNTTSF
jgi:HAE1 family hydrophobic/amphiphilic exporter-1